jgi:hypothetical protein
MRTSTKIKRIERLEQEYSLKKFGSDDNGKRQFVTWEEFSFIHAVHKKCEELGDSDAELVRRACRLATDWETSYTRGRRTR